MNENYRPLTFVTIGELRAMQTPEWLIEGLIQEQSTVMMYGLEGSHKSFLALDMAFSVASGTACFGRAVKTQKVLYVASEGGPPLRERLEAWERARGVRLADEQCVTFVMDETMLLDDAAMTAHYAGQLAAEGFAFIVFDTLRTSSQGDEIKSEVMQAITRSMRILQRTCNATVMIVHHSTKGNAEVYAGHGSAQTNISTSICVLYDEKTGITTMKCKKQKDADRFEPMAFTHRKVGASLVMERQSKRQPRATTPVLAENDKVVFEWLRDEEQGIAARASLRAIFIDDRGMGERTYDRVIERLANRHKLVEVSEDVVRVA